MRNIAKMTSLALLLAIGSMAHADPITGVAVDSAGSTAAVGTTAADGSIVFYVPMTDVVETYGVAGGGMSADNCATGDGTCTGGVLEMYLYFDVAASGVKHVNLLFQDLDVAGVNDPWFFIEDLLVQEVGSGATQTVYNAGGLAAGDYDSQLVSFDVNTTGAFHLYLQIASSFNPESPNGEFRNTAEALHATVRVPEPGALAMMGMGLLLLGMRRRRAAIRQARQDS